MISRSTLSPRHQLRPGRSLRPHEGGSGHVDLREEDVVDDLPAHSLDRANFDPRLIGGNQQHGQSFVLAAGSVGPADEHDVRGELGFANPCLVAVSQIGITAPLGLAPQRSDVRAGPRLAHRDGCDLAFHEPTQDGLLLSFSAEALNRSSGDQRHAEGTDWRQPVGRLLQEQAHVGHPAAAPAPTLGDGDAEPTECGDPFVELGLCG